MTIGLRSFLADLVSFIWLRLPIIQGSLRRAAQSELDTLDRAGRIGRTWRRARDWMNRLLHSWLTYLAALLGALWFDLWAPPRTALLPLVTSREFLDVLWQVEATVVGISV